MTDLEKVKLCAAAMGLSVYTLGRKYEAVGYALPDDPSGFVRGIYDPLHDDAQAMALVKELKITIGAPDAGDDAWYAEIGTPGKFSIYMASANKNLNRAIVECVAKIMEARK